MCGGLLIMQSPVPPDAVRIEEMINYFNLHYREPAKGDVFRIESQLTSCPWDIDEQLLFLNINAKKLNLDTSAAGQFCFSYRCIRKYGYAQPAAFT